jgi:hypothetical protein
LVREKAAGAAKVCFKVRQLGGQGAELSMQWIERVGI